MNRKKTMIALLIVVSILMSVGIPAFAVNAQYSTTKAFLNAMDEESYKYTYVGIDNDNDEKITVKFNGDYMDTVNVNIYFNQDLDVVTMRVWDVIDFNEDDYEKVLLACNDLHRQYKFVTFLVDTSDWSVTAKLDCPIRPGKNCGDICVDGMEYIVNITDLAYDSLSVYGK